MHPPEMSAAIQALDQAENILRICHGTDHNLASHQLRRHGELHKKILLIGEEVIVSRLLA